MNKQSFQNQWFRLRSIAPLPFYIICLVFSQFNWFFLLSGFFLISAGEWIRFYSAGFIGKKSRHLESPVADNLITAGPYQKVRNPIYIGNILIYLGFAVLSNVFLPYFFFTVLVFFSLNYSWIVRIEEKYLAVKFGDAYEQYCQNVNRWIPRFVRADHTEMSFCLKKAFQSERPTILVMACALALILIRMSAGWFSIRL